jgi:glycosyltransferase involved in cell wall biosynthesis
MEGLTEAQRRAMVSCWDAFHTIPCDLQVPRPAPGHAYGLDDWYDPQLGSAARALHDRWRFDAIVVNYVWLSRLLDALPPTVHKVLDTHDVFGGRDRAFAALGLAPEWYYTTPEAERAGLERADTVIAIQDLEAEHFRGLLGGSRTTVTTVGHASPARFLPARCADARPVVGYLGSGNPFNLRSVRQFAGELAAAPELARRFRFLLAGSICQRLRAAPPPLEMLGPVDDLHSFYGRIDLAVNPMLGGSGLKIKTLEAMSFGLPVLGTDDAWAGLDAPDTIWPGGVRPGLLEALRYLAEHPTTLEQLRFLCRERYRRYVARQLEALAALFPRGRERASVSHPSNAPGPLAT